MRCAHCQGELDPQETFCGNCGQSVAVVAAPSALPAASHTNPWPYIALVLLAGATLGVWYFKDSLPPFPGGKSGSLPSPTASAPSAVTTTTPAAHPIIAVSPVPTPEVVATVQPGTLVLTASPPPQLTPTPFVTPPISHLPPQVLQPAVPHSQVRAVINDPDGFTHVRTGPGMSYPIQTRVLAGEVFTTTVSNDRWWHITTKDGITGYMHRSRIHVIE